MTLCDKLRVAFLVVAHVIVFGQPQYPKLIADGSRLVYKRRLVKQSTLAEALSVPWHHYGCICTPVSLALWYSTPWL